MNTIKTSKTRLLQEVKELRRRVQTLEKLELERERSHDALMEAIGSMEDEIAQTETIIAAIGDGISIQNKDLIILYQNQVHKEIMGVHVGESCAQVYRQAIDGKGKGCPLTRSFKDGRIHRMEIEIEDKQKSRFVEVTASCLKDSNSKIVAGIEIVRDITARKTAETERERLIVELKEAIAQIKTLTGLLPICAACKKIRDDKGYWSKIEKYIETHTTAEFTHGICPDCANELYPDLYKDFDKDLG